ncbi:hypothetical protein PLESTB_001271500 [Pleodorina starrii]|uniref:Uncharacterized protein n=1 Tax=Pleodorina starrii TaxID=330485 RepID=A0A9W6BTY7_9CHLO|nr:hypothetical protein PLESTB_001271500 [Pleodorina starrii]
MSRPPPPPPPRGGGHHGADSRASQQPYTQQSYKYKYRAEEVREAYLSDKESGMASALRDALKSLFSEPRLPDNPYYYLAATLAAHVDQSALWKTPAADLLSAYDIEGGLEPLYGDLQLCKIGNFSRCCGLPHVLRVVSREGASFLHETLVNGLPECLFHPSPLVVSTGTDGGGGECSVQTLCSVQGSTALWNPQWLEFPEIEIRCDVVIRGGKLEEALRQFVGMVVADVRELNQIPVYFVDGIAIRDSPAVMPDPEKEPFRLWYPVEAVLGLQGGGQGGDFEKAAARLVLGGKVLQLHAVLLLDGPADPSDPTATKLRYEVAKKTYLLHHHSDPDARPSMMQPMSHFGCNPYDALYGGYFLDVSTARQYGVLYIGTDREPYHRDNLTKQHGNSLTAWRQLLLLVLLHDPTTVKPGQLVPDSFPSLETLALQAPKLLRSSSSSSSSPEVAWLLSSIPNLLRINNSAACVLEGIVRELEGLEVAAARWPAKLAAVRAAAAAASATDGSDGGGGGDGGGATPRTGDSRRTVRTPDVARSMATWLATFGLEGRLLGQLLGLRGRILAAIGSGNGLFAGISLMVQRLVSELPGEVPPLAPAAAAALAAAQPRAALLRHLLHAAALTVAHGFVTRCADVKWALHYLRIAVAGSADLAALQTIAAAGAGGGGGGAARDELSGGAPPPAAWVLDVGMVRGAKVRSGALAERVGTEGVMLQYAVDTKLDELLATIWQVMTDPPLPVNPYPRLLHLLRSQAAKMELWNEEPEQALASYLVNELTLLRPPSFIYAAHLPPEAPARFRSHNRSNRSNRRGQGPGAGGSGADGAAAAAGGDVEDDLEGLAVGDGGYDQLVGYGCYAAVSCVDVRALAALRSSLGAVLSDRHWQSGAYQGEVVPALVGDIAVSNALRLDRDGLGAAGGLQGGGGLGGGGGGGGGLQRGGGGGGVFGSSSSSSAAAGRGVRLPVAPFEHPRLYGLETEEHHLVRGPRRREAALAFAREVVSDLQQLHTSSSHLVFSVGVVGGSYFDANDLWAPTATTVATANGPGAAAAAGGGPQPEAGGGGAGGAVSYSGLERLRAELVEAALRVAEGRLLASVALYVAPARENTYVALTRHLLFQYRKVNPTLVPNISVTAAMPQPRRPTTAEQQADLWPSAVYQRVFLSEFNASTWYSWNSARGDPAQPYHYRAMVAAVQEAAPKLEASGRVLQLQRSLLQAAVALQDLGAVYELSRVFASPAQELKCLQEVHQALLDLLSPRHETLHAKLDNERVRRLLMTYVQRVRSALTSPKYNYFSGLAAAVPAVLAELQEEVLSSFRLNPRLQDLMQQLAVWTHSCEISVAAAVHAGVGDFRSLLSSGEGGAAHGRGPGSGPGPGAGAGLWSGLGLGMGLET